MTSAATHPPLLPWNEVPSVPWHESLRAARHIRRDMLGVVSSRFARHGPVVRQGAGPMQMVNLAFQLRKRKVIVGLVTPGATATDFIPEQFRKAIKGIQTPEQATSDMIRNIDRFSVANTGTFFDYTGEIVPW